MNILADFHHADLWWSLQLLANRLGAILYRPYGLSWYDQGYFKLYGDLRRKDPTRWIAKQYLWDTIFDLPNTSIVGIGRETYNGCADYPKFNLLPPMLLEQIPIDIVICSVNENEPYFAKLKEFYPNAKFIRQVGNDLDTNIDESLYPNLLASATAPYNAFQGHKVLYRQEWDMSLFQPEPPTNFKNIWSFQNDIEQFEDIWEFWTDLKHKLRDYNFKSFGVGNENGKIYPKRELYKKMSESTFGFQSKGPWEGYGFAIHNSIWLGRPMIIKFSDYQGKMAEPLLIKDQTYLEMDDELPDKIRSLSKNDIIKMSEKCMQVFKENIDFDLEFLKIKKFFEELI